MPVPASASRMICWAGASWAGSCPARAGWGARGTRLTHSRPGRVTPGPGCAGGGLTLCHRPPAMGLGPFTVLLQAMGSGTGTGTPVLAHCTPQCVPGWAAHPGGAQPAEPAPNPGQVFTLKPNDDFLSQDLAACVFCPCRLRERTPIAESAHGISWEKPPPALPLPSPELRESRALPERVPIESPLRGVPQCLGDHPISQSGAAASAGQCFQESGWGGRESAPGGAQSPRQLSKEGSGGRT